MFFDSKLIGAVLRGNIGPLRGRNEPFLGVFGIIPAAHRLNLNSDTAQRESPAVPALIGKRTRP